MSEGKRIKITPNRHTAITVTTAGDAMSVEAVAVGFLDPQRPDEGGDTVAHRLRMIAGYLARYADALDPLFVEDITPRVAAVTMEGSTAIVTMDMRGAPSDAMRGPEAEPHA